MSLPVGRRFPPLLLRCTSAPEDLAKSIPRAKVFAGLLTASAHSAWAITTLEREFIVYDALFAECRKRVAA